MMISCNIFDPVLLDPVRDGADELYIVSGYATSAMAFHHLKKIEECGLAEGSVNLIVGMTSLDGISIDNHKGFQSLMGLYKDRFVCSYVFNQPPVHSKIYVWCKRDIPVSAFVGSPNYTQNAFYRQREVVNACDPKEALKYFSSLSKETIYCTHGDVDNVVRMHKKIYTEPEDKSMSPGKPIITGLETVNVSLLNHMGEMHGKAGLNWGQRGARNRNEAYIPLKADIVHSDFFPEKGIHFTVNTDDGKILICTRAQGDSGGKAIQTPHDNSLIGEYFRNRMGLMSGDFVTKNDLLNYGRTDVDFYKIDFETFFMDFSVGGS
ncbi:MAG: NgoFVII family restriction endonuclease [Clostridia bacterium]|nr:NgoFVII family restriction endonuclease [Clostridia bacterium]